MPVICITFLSIIQKNKSTIAIKNMFVMKLNGGYDQRSYFSTSSK